MTTTEGPQTMVDYENLHRSVVEYANAVPPEFVADYNWDAITAELADAGCSSIDDVEPDEWERILTDHDRSTDA
jgi:hypothetical protein